MPELDDEIRRRMRRAVDEAEAGSRRRGARAAGANTNANARRRLSGALPAVLSLATAGALVAGIIAIGPRLHHTAVAVNPLPSPSPSSAPALSTLLPTLSPTALPSTLPAALPTPTQQPTPHPTPTPVPWNAPPVTVTEPQLMYVPNGQSSSGSSTVLHLAEMDWTGTVHGHLDVPGPDCQCINVPMQGPPSYLPSPDGSRVVSWGSKVLGPDGGTLDTLPAGIKALAWDDDNRHLCTLSGPGSTRLSWIGPGGVSLHVATFTAPQYDFWWVLACDSQRNRVVVARFDNPPSSPGAMMVELRSVQISSGATVHDRSIPRGSYPEASGDGTVVAVGGNGVTTDFYDADSGDLLHTSNFTVNALSWDGSRAAGWTGQCCTNDTEEVLDWRQELPVYTRPQTNGTQWFRDELHGDLALRYATYPPGGEVDEVDIVHPDGTFSTHPITSS